MWLLKPSISAARIAISLRSSGGASIRIRGVMGVPSRPIPNRSCRPSVPSGQRYPWNEDRHLHCRRRRQTTGSSSRLACAARPDVVGLQDPWPTVSELPVWAINKAGYGAPGTCKNHGTAQRRSAELAPDRADRSCVGRRRANRRPSYRPTRHASELIDMSVNWCVF